MFPSEARRVRQVASPSGLWETGGCIFQCNRYGREPGRKTEMLTPKGEHPFPCSTRGMFDGRISFDGIATPPKTFGSWILWPCAFQVK